MYFAECNETTTRDFAKNTEIVCKLAYISPLLQTGVLSSVPHIAKVVLAFTSGWLADALLNSGRLSTSSVRKLLTGSGNV